MGAARVPFPRSAMSGTILSVYATPFYTQTNGEGGRKTRLSFAGSYASFSSPLSPPHLSHPLEFPSKRSINFGLHNSYVLLLELSFAVAGCQPLVATPAQVRSLAKS
ncbi:hypothetical protein ACTXT7_004055 [Hymenolepis weldensis]